MKWLSGIIWAYAGEIVFTLLLMVLLLLTTSPETISRNTVSIVGDLIVLSTVYTGVTAAFLSVGIQLLVGDFGEWMRRKESDITFVKAFEYTLCVQFLCVLSLLWTSIHHSTIPGVISAFMLIYSTVLMFSSIWNTTALFRLKIEFDGELAREKMRLEQYPGGADQETRSKKNNGESDGHLPQ